MNAHVDLPSSSLGRSHKHSVSIVGAGVAGLVAAFDLMKLGLPGHRIRIFEAENYIGGRVRTKQYGNRSFDIGAQWLHGGKNNSFRKWIKETAGDKLKSRFGVDRFQDFFFDDKLAHVWMMNNTLAVDKQQTPNAFRVAGREMTEKLYQEFKTVHPDRDISFAELVRGKGELAENYIKLVSSTWMAQYPSRISSDEFFAEPSGSGGLQVKIGLGRLVQELGNLAKEKGVEILTHHQAVALRRSAAGVEIECRALGESRRFESSAAFVTVSIGVLQKGDIRFEPTLPKEVADAIDSMQMSNLCRALLPVRHKFFAERGDLAKGVRIDVFHGRKLPVFGNLRPAGRDSIEVVGRLVERQHVNTLLRADVLAGVEGSLKAEPKIVDWESMSHFRGSYSTRKVGHGRPGDNAIIDDRILIGGEAWPRDEDGGSTLEGAQVSGSRAAKQIISRLIERSPKTLRCLTNIGVAGFRNSR